MDGIGDIDGDWIVTFLKKQSKENKSQMERIIEEFKKYNVQGRTALFLLLYYYKYVQCNEGYVGLYEACDEINIKMCNIRAFIKNMVDEEIFDFKKQNIRKKKISSDGKTEYKKKVIRLVEHPLNHRIFRFLKNREE